MIETVKDLIVALLDHPMDASVELGTEDGVRSVWSVERVATVAFGQQVVRIDALQ